MYNYEKIRSLLKDYYGTAMYSGLPMAMMDLSKVETASNSELLIMAKAVHIDVSLYEAEIDD